MLRRTKGWGSELSSRNRPVWLGLHQDGGSSPLWSQRAIGTLLSPLSRHDPRNLPAEASGGYGTMFEPPAGEALASNGSAGVPRQLC